MPTHEVDAADIWVGDTQPTTADPEDFWLDTTKVPLFGIDIIGTIPGTGPPVAGVPPVPATPPDPGDAWWDGDGGLWVWDGTDWVYQGNFRGPTGPAGPIGPTGPPAFNILGSLPPGNNGPPVVGVPPVPATPPNPGDAWFGDDGSIWVWDGASWVQVDTGGAALPPGGNPGDILITDGAGDAVWAPVTTHPAYIDLEARVAAIETYMPSLIDWILTADWSSDGVTVVP